MKKLLYVKTNGYDMLVSVDGENNVRYLTETGDFPVLSEEPGEQLERALEFLNSVEDDSSWEDAGEVESLDEWLNLDGHAGDVSEIIAEIEADM